jgi:hypothetical protein
MANSGGDRVNDGIVFWIRACTNDLVAKILSDAPAGDILYGNRIDVTRIAAQPVSDGGRQ